jgi:hypothetical protein
MLLISYVKTATNKRYSYLRVTTIQMDVHHVGKNPINTSHSFHTHSEYGHQPYVSHVVHV